MSGGKELWLAEFEQIGDALADNLITRKEAIARWEKLGMLRLEAEVEADYTQGLA